MLQPLTCWPTGNRYSIWPHIEKYAANAFEADAVNILLFIQTESLSNDSALKPQNIDY